MSRSYRKTPITGIAVCDSEKDDKRRAHRRRRAAERSHGRFVDLREVSDVWDMGKDGKAWWGDRAGRLLRK